MAELDNADCGGAPDAGRRKLLKLVAAAGGAVAATAILPGTWSKPIAQIGALPAHAQASDVPITLTNPLLIAASPDARQDQVAFAPAAGLNIRVQCDWDDPLARLDGNTYLQTFVMNCGSYTNATFASGYASGLYPYWHISAEGPGGTSGTMVFNVVTPCLNGNYLEWWVTDEGRSSEPPNPYLYLAS